MRETHVIRNFKQLQFEIYFSDTQVAFTLENSYLDVKCQTR